MEQPDENCCNGDDPRIKTREIDYDANGNQLEIKETIGELEVSLRKNLWDEENRLTAVNLKPDSSRQHPIGVYTYDAGGERIIKRNLNRLKIRSNANEVEDVEEDNMMLYPSGLIIAKPDIIDRKGTLLLNYTKHYYVGSQRMATKIGTTNREGLFPNAITTIVPNLNTQEIKDLSEIQVDKANTALQAVYNTFELEAPNLSFPQQDDATFYFPHTGDLEVFYFHPDHLGSSSYITNLDGNVTQHMEYLPFGETLVDEHTNSNNSPFKFNGKELDEETGNYYYSARYYNPKWSIWLSVDPMAEKYPSWSPYSYTLNNPVIYTDPTGMVVESPDTDYGLTKDGKITQIGPTNDDPDRLFALDDNGNKNTEIDHLVVNDKNVLSSLSEDDPNFVAASIWGNKVGAWAKTNSKKDAYNVFKFGSDNSGVEWALQEYSDNRFVIGNNHFSETVGNLESVSGYNILDLKRHYHGHPGLSPVDNYASGRDGDQGVAERITWDFLNGGVKDYSKHPTFHIYRPALKESFQYNPWKTKFNTRSIKTSNGL